MRGLLGRVAGDYRPSSLIAILWTGPWCQFPFDPLLADRFGRHRMELLPVNHFDSQRFDLLHHFRVRENSAVAITIRGTSGDCLQFQIINSTMNDDFRHARFEFS